MISAEAIDSLLGYWQLWVPQLLTLITLVLFLAITLKFHIAYDRRLLSSLIFAAATVLLQALKFGLIIAYAIGKLSGNIGALGLWLTVALAVLPCLAGGLLAFKVHLHGKSTDH